MENQFHLQLVIPPTDAHAWCCRPFLHPSQFCPVQDSHSPLTSRSLTVGKSTSTHGGMNVNMGAEEQLLRHHMAEVEEMAIAAHSQ